MQVLRLAPNDSRPDLRPVERDEHLQDANKQVADHLVMRHKIPKERVIGVMQEMDLRDRVMLEIEMRERQQNLWTAEYNPFERL